MRTASLVVCLMVAIVLVKPSAGQLRQDAARIDAPARVYDAGQTGISLNRYFSPAHFRMSHSFEMSSGSFGGTMAMYTNSMMWQFSSQLAARVDVGVARMPDMPGASLTGSDNTRVFLRNAELAYRPKSNVLLHLSVRQSPYGRYMNPYGAYSPYGYGMGGYGFQSVGGGNMFWNPDLR